MQSFVWEDNEEEPLASSLLLRLLLFLLISISPPPTLPPLHIHLSSAYSSSSPSPSSSPLLQPDDDGGGGDGGDEEVAVFPVSALAGCTCGSVEGFQRPWRCVLSAVVGGGLSNCSVTVVGSTEEPQCCHEVILTVARVADCLSSFVCVCACVYI